MAKLLPPHVEWTDPKRDGEKLVYEWLSNPAIPGTAYYSLLQKNHTHKMIGEIDYLYVCERGFLCIEVKGGQKIYREDTQWYSLSRSGEVNDIHNPFVQAKDCRYALEKHLKAELKGCEDLFDGIYGYAVVFPQCIFTGSGNDLMTEVMFDNRYSITDFPKFINDCFDYWEQKELEKHNFRPKKISQQSINCANTILRGDFSVIPSLKLPMETAEAKMAELTEEQTDIIEAGDETDRVIVKGVAGTGKTILAKDRAKRSAAGGDKVLYLCYNSNMVKYVTNSLKEDGIPDLGAIDVSTYHALLSHLMGTGPIYDKSITEISEMYLDAAPDIEQYDYIVLDEGQDLIRPEVLFVLDSLVKGGIKDGRWMAFLDPNQNIFNRCEEFEAAYADLLTYRPAVLQLTHNCRNTEPIAKKTTVLSWVDAARYQRIEGPPVTMRSYGSKAEFISNFKHDVAELLAMGLSPKDIVVLSRYKKENSLLADIDTVCNLELKERNTTGDYGQRCLNYYTIQSYKGLESKIVLLVDTDGFSSVADRQLNYVGMSRARINLYMYYDLAKQDEYFETAEHGRELL